MKKIMAILFLSAITTVAYAACRTNTYMMDGRIVTCTVCCDTMGNCTTTCF